MIDPTKWISRSRFDEYMLAANQDVGAARELYEWNTSISAAFFELLSHVEVSLRNAIDDALRPLEVVETARRRHQYGWWFSSGTFLRDEELKFYEAAWRHLGGASDSVSRDKLLASMTFGLWDGVLSTNYETMFRKHIIHSFPHRPAQLTQKTMYTFVLSLRKLRNRIAHHQPIFDLPLEERYEQAMDLLEWIDPDLRKWVDGLSRVRDLLDVRPSAAESIAVVVPATHAWDLYEKHGAYVCQPGRFFRQVSHVAFYKDAAVQIEVGKVLERIDRVDWSAEEIDRRMKIGTERERRIALVIKAARQSEWDGDEYQLFLLSTPSDDAAKGHVTLDQPIRQPRRGRGSAWVRRQRYVPVDRLKTARTVGDLEQI